MEKELIDRLKERVEHALTSNTEECIPFKYKDRDGYGTIQFCHKGKKGKCRAHRLVYEIVHNDELNPENVIMHSCDNPNCCNPRHLSKGTHKDNHDDKVNKGRQAKGKTNGRYRTGYHSKFDPVEKPKPLFGDLFGRKLTVEKVLEVKKLIKLKLLLTEVSKLTGVAYNTVKDINNNKAYKNVV